MNMQKDMEPSQNEDFYATGHRIAILAEMLIDLQARRNDGEISHAVYINGLNMLERLAGGERLR